MRDAWGRTLTPAAAVVFGLALFWVYTSINPITGSNIQSAAELVIPVFETADEEPAVNQSKGHTPKPVLLLPAPTETPPLMPTEMATNPQASEAVEVALQKSFAEAVGPPSGPATPAAKSPWFASPPLENMPALPQEDSPRSPEDPYVDEMLRPVLPQTAPSDVVPTSTEETSAQSPQPPPELVPDTGTYPQPRPPNLPADAGTAHQPLAPPEETTSSSDLPAHLPPSAEDTAYLE